MNYNIVWFKKDLRTTDHAPLSSAIQEGATVGIFVIEPEWFSSPEFDSSHYVFLQESLRDLQSDLRKIGVPLLIEIGETIETFQSIQQRFGIRKIFSHEETGSFIGKNPCTKRWKSSSRNSTELIFRH